MSLQLRKAIRTAQNAFPPLRIAKEFLQYRARRLLRIPHERDFEIVRFFGRHENCFIDVGANQGQSIESILIFRPDARIISFEANPHLADKLGRRYAGQPNINVHPTGLGETPGGFTLYVPSYNGYVYDGVASLDRETTGGWLAYSIYGFKKSRLTIQEVPCRIETLDSFQLAPDFIKIDVQGNEYNVLLGGQVTLAQHEPVLMIEVCDDSRVYALLRQYNYREYYLNKGQLMAGRAPDAKLKFLFMTERRIGLLTNPPCVQRG